MRFTEATKPDRKSGGSRGTCSAPFLNATAKGEGLKAAELLDREAHRTSAPVRDDEKARRVLWYPTQAKTGLDPDFLPRCAREIRECAFQ
jgi:hypothetical protein